MPRDAARPFLESALVISRQRMSAVVKGIIVGTAFWCLLATLQILPRELADTPGLLAIVALGSVASLLRRDRILFTLFGVVSGTILLVSLSPISTAIARRWVRQNAIPRDGVDAIVILSSGTNPDTTMTGDALDRLVAGMELVDKGFAPTLVTTTVQEFYPDGLVSSDVDQSRIMNLLMHRSAWLRAPGGTSTHDEAVAVSALLPQGTRRIGLVTSPMHTRRACAVFEAVGFIVTCIPARMRDLTGMPLAATPENRLTIFGQWIYEVAAVGEYAVRGWLRRSH